jgi:glycerate kinase
MGPLPDMTLTASFGWLPESRTAVVEMACASGLPLLRPRQRDPLRTTTLGTGQLLAAAVRQGAQRLLLTLGGSATVDGGTGAARALGWRLLDENGRDVPLGGGNLTQIRRLVPPSDPLPAMEALCDVRNPLLGEQGAARVFGPQKGADAAMVARLEDGLRHLAALFRDQLGVDVTALPGAGAAGGFGAGALAFFGARLVPGVQTVFETLNLDEHLRWADWVITGEGCFDRQSLQGKVVSGVRDAARARRVPVAVLAGEVRLSPDQWRQEGIALALAIRPPAMPLDEAMARAAELLAAAAASLPERLERLSAGRA